MSDQASDREDAARLSPAAEARLAAAQAAREQRLAKALRENLKRRKAQGRGRAASGDASAEPASADADVFS